MLKTRALSAIAAIALTLILTAVAGANVSETAGDVVEISPPTSVAHHDLESNDDVHLFSEAQNVILPKPLRVDITRPGGYQNSSRLSKGRIPKGTEINSYLLHSDPVRRPRRAVSFGGTVEFDEEVLGIIVTNRKLRLTDDTLGSESTDYPDKARLRGLELGRNRDGVRLSDDRHSVSIRFKTSVYIDQIRVITAANGDEGAGEAEGSEGDTLSDGLVGYWTFENDSGQTVTDHSGNNNDGVFGSSSDEGSDDPSWTSDSAFGQYALEFDGIDDFVDVGDRPEFDLPVYTWSIWLNAPESPASNSIGQPMSNGDEQFVVSWNHTQPGFIASAAHKTGNSWIGAQISSPLEGGEWLHLAASYNGSELKIYLNGVLEETVNVGAPNSIAGNLTFGSGHLFGSPTSYFAGMIDEVRIYDRALTNEEIEQLAAR